jgi:protoheme IX farnesyltransferase
VDGHVSAGAWVLFLIVFLWTPPHFWPIAIVRQREYAAAGLPMMPAAVGDQGTRRRSLAYTLALLPVTALPVLLGDLGVIYGVAAGGLGLAFLALVARSLVERRPAFDQRVFEGSVAYLSALFLAMLVDLAVG